MEKTYLFDNTEYKLRFLISENQPWFLGTDLWSVAGCDFSTMLNAVNAEDKCEFEYKIPQGSGRSLFISMYGLVKCMTLAESIRLAHFEDAILLFKIEVLPYVFKALSEVNKLSKEDQLILKLVKSDDADNRAQYVRELRKELKPPVKAVTKPPKKKVTADDIKDLLDIKSVNNLCQFKRGQLTNYLVEIGVLKPNPSKKAFTIEQPELNYCVKATVGSSVNKLMFTEVGVSFIKEHADIIRSY